ALMAYSLEAARILGTLRYSRQYEAEADAAGLRMLATARVDPRGLSSFLGQLVPAEKGAPPALAYFASHPATAERITTLQRLAASGRQPCREGQGRAREHRAPRRDGAGDVRVCRRPPPRPGHGAEPRRRPTGADQGRRPSARLRRQGPGHGDGLDRAARAQSRRESWIRPGIRHRHRAADPAGEEARDQGRRRSGRALTTPATEEA